MKAYTKLTLIIIISFFILTAKVSSVYAQCGFITLPGGTTVYGQVFPNGCVDTPGGVINAFLPAVLGILGFITVIMIVISGIQFISSSGNPEAAGAARGRLTYAIIGFIIIVLSYAILQIVNRLFLGPTGLT